MGTHNLQAFCTATLSDSTNILTDQEFSSDLDRVTGHKQGIARLKLENKVLRQSSVVAASIAEFIVTYCSTAQNYNVADTETPASIAAKLRGAVQNQTFPAGTRLAFSQNTAPLGWVQVNDSSTNGMMLRIINNTTSTTAGVGIVTTGGIHSPILMNVVPQHTHGGTTAATDTDHLHTFNVNSSQESAAHVHNVSGLTLNTSANHNHNLNIRRVGVQVNDANPIDYFSPLAATDGVGTTGFNNQDHKHTIPTLTSGQESAVHVHNVAGGTSKMDRASVHAHTFSTDTGSSGTDWQPKYIDFILCVKS
jgi:hypothetical protein